MFSRLLQPRPSGVTVLARSQGRQSAHRSRTDLRWWWVAALVVLLPGYLACCRVTDDGDDDDGGDGDDDVEHDDHNYFVINIVIIIIITDISNIHLQVLNLSVAFPVQTLGFECCLFVCLCVSLCVCLFGVWYFCFFCLFLFCLLVSLFCFTLDLQHTMGELFFFAPTFNCEFILLGHVKQRILRKRNNSVLKHSVHENVLALLISRAAFFPRHTHTPHCLALP